MLAYGVHYPPYATIDKRVGETPLEATERLRALLSLPINVSLAYAGRLDPMASGKLLILIGDTCKIQEQFHSLDKTYEVGMLLGISSDTGDVLGIVQPCEANTYTCSIDTVRQTAKSLIGPIELPYPHFSSKTVRGKPLHEWKLEGKIGEIEIPLKRSRIFTLSIDNIETISKTALLETVRRKIETIPTVTDERKALGRDFRRVDVRQSWDEIEKYCPNESFTIVHFTRIASSGTYMRSLCELLAQKLGTAGLAYEIHRTTIGRYVPLFRQYGIWQKRF